jgi:hypothetical protein
MSRLESENPRRKWVKVVVANSARPAPEIMVIGGFTPRPRLRSYRRL